MLRKIFFFLLVLMLTAGSVYIFTRRENDSLQVEVRDADLQARFRSFVTASGEIVATRYADIGSDVMGKITSLPVVEGQTVRAGQILAQIDSVQAESDLAANTEAVRALQADEAAALQAVEVARSQLARAEAVLREEKVNLDRVQRLYNQGIAPRADLDSRRASFERAEADVASAKASVDQAEKALSAFGRRVAQAQAQKGRSLDLLAKTEIRSPIDGVVSRLQVREGEMVVVGIQNQPGTTLMTISDLSGINAEVKAAEADILRIQLGQKAEVSLDALMEKRFSGRVIEIGSSALPSVGTGTAAREFRVVIQLDSPEPGMRPGLTCDAEILTTEVENAVTVPLQAVVIRDVEDKEQTGVFLLQEGKAVFVPVQAGVIGGLDIVVDGIEEGDPVIIGPFQILRELQDGDSVARTDAETG